MHVYADEPEPLGPPTEAELNAQYDRDERGREHYESEAVQARLRAAFPLPTDPPVAADAVGDTPEEVSDA